MADQTVLAQTAMTHKNYILAFDSFPGKNPRQNKVEDGNLVK
jgi:hypothetical protein